MKKKRLTKPRPPRRHILNPGEGYVLCPVEKARIIREFIHWLEHEQSNVIGVRCGAVFYAPHSLRDTEDSPIGRWVRKNTVRRKCRK